MSTHPERRARGWMFLAIAVLLTAPLSGCPDDEAPGGTDGGADVVDEGAGETGDADIPDADVADGDAAPDASSSDAADADASDAADLAAPPLRLDAVEVAPRALELRLLRGDEMLLRFDAGAIQVGFVERILDSRSYDPYPFFVERGNPLFPPPPLDHWASISEIDVVAESDEAITLDLTFDDGATGSLALSRGPGGVTLDLVATPASSDEGGGAVAYYRLRPEVDGDEGFYGLGEWFDRPEHRGTVRAMQLEVDTELESANNEAHVPVPLLIGTRGWGLFVESYYPGVFEVAGVDPERVDVIFGTGAGSAQGLRFHLFVADHPLDVTRAYYETTGYPVRPAPWALGPWIWRDENRDQAQVVSDANTLRELDLATSALWIDRPYASGVNSFDFDPARFDDPQAMIDELHDLGLRVALWHTPYVDSSDEATAELYAEAREEGYLPPSTGLLLNRWGPPVDFTNPDAVAWWQGLIGRYTEMGIEGFKLDYGEDIAVAPIGGRNRFVFADGSDELTMHSRYQLLYHQTYAELLPESGGFLLCRGGTFGDQRHVSVIWPGDLDANFARIGDTVSDGDDEYVAVGGLPAAVSAALSLGPSGFPLFASDTGGYRHSPPDRETFTRWFEMSALAPVMQIGTSTNDVAWEFTEENGFDEEMLGWYREYTRLHLRLWPFFWTLVHRLEDDGRPIQRAFGLAWPELGLHPADVYALGDELLVAPVVERGARTRTLPLPPGTWLDWWTGERHEGPGELTVDAPLGTLPLFLGAGAVVPMLRPTIDTLSPTAVPERVDSYDTDPGVLYAVAALGGAGSFELFDGARLAVSETDSGFVIESADGSAFDSGALVTLIGVEPANWTVTLDGDELLAVDTFAGLEFSEAAWVYIPRERGGSWSVRVPGGSHRVEVVVGVE